jgi:ATP-dependent Clp protease ATP-binding subunit ClpX
MEGILLETMFELPSLTTVEEVVVNKEVVDNNAKPLMIHNQRKGDVGSAS